MAACEHNAEFGCDYPCISCDPTPDDPRLHSIGFGFGPGGKDHWHNGQTLREAEHEIVSNAKRYGIEPQYMGPRSKRTSNEVFHT